MHKASEEWSKILGGYKKWLWNASTVAHLMVLAYQGFIVGFDSRTNASNSMNYSEGHSFFL